MFNEIPLLPIATLSQYLFGPLLFVLSLFMILLILVQRGKGGGLTGALGGPGGQSVFGSKAGDLFTRITVVVASIWIFLLAFAVYWYNEDSLSSALAGNEDSPSVVVGAGDPAVTPSVPSVGEANVGDLGSGEMMSGTPDSTPSAEAPSVSPPETPAPASEPVATPEVSAENFPKNETPAPEAPAADAPAPSEPSN